MRRARAEDGFALISAMMIILVVIGLGLAMLLFNDEQQHASTYEQSRESAYTLAEAALNAQIFQLSLQWPTEKNPAPTSCTEATSTSTNACPNAAGISASAGYPAAGTCTGTDAWGSALSSRWTTYVRSDTSTSQLFNSTIDKANASYDNGDGSVWVRAVGVSQCKAVVLISKVSEQLVALPFPRSVLTANGFSTSNSGSKVILNTLGSSATQPAGVSVRCEGLTSAQCKKYTIGQVSPDTTSSTPASPAQTLTATQLESLKAQAKVNGTYFKTGTCPASMAALTGAPTYVEGPCNLGEFSGGEANSNASPGFLVLYNGTLKLGGTAAFWGVVYAVNAQLSSGEVVVVHGNAKVVGAIDVDGRGTVGLGSSAPNLIYDPRAFNLLKTFSGAAPTPNTFRVLPSGQ